MTRGSPRTDLPAVGALPARDARGLARLAAVLVVVALGVGIALTTAGQRWPPAGMVVVFAVLSWFAVNRYTFFPSELAVTSESAVLLAAVVVFHRDAPLLGAWCVAALVGPLDAVHWEQRAFSRMGFNAAHQMLAVVAAGAVLSALVEPAALSLDDAPEVGVAVVVYALVVWLAGVAALRVWSHLGLVAAVERLAPLDWVVVPLGLLGAAAGIAAWMHGWWAVPLVLVPVAFLPELVLGQAQSLIATCISSSRVRAAVLVLVAATLVASIVVVTVGVSALSSLGVGVLACLAAVELAPRRRAVVPPLVGVVVAVAAAALVLGPPWSSPMRTLGAVLAGLLVAGAAAVTAPAGSRVFELTRVVWAVPLFAVGVAAALAVVRVGPGAAAVPAVVVVACAALVVLGASPPWSSSLLAPALGERRFRGRRATLASLAVLAVGAATIAARTSEASGLTRVCCTLAALAATEVGLAVAAAGARQWRVEPRRRRAVAALVVLAAVACLVAFPLLARHAAAWLVPATIVAGAVVLLVGGRPARLGDESRGSYDRG